MMSSEAEAHPNRFDSADSFESEGRTTGSRLSVYGLSVAAIGSVGKQSGSKRPCGHVYVFYSIFILAFNHTPKNSQANTHTKHTPL